MKMIGWISLFTVVAALAAAPAPAPSVADLKSPAATGSEGGNVAVASDGRVFFSWLEPTAPNGYALRFSVRGPQGWSAPKTVSRGTNWFVSGADFPSMSVLSDGTLAANWLVATGGPSSEAYDINLAFSKDGGATWGKPVLPHRDRKKRQHGFLSLVPTADGKLGAIWLDGRNMPDEETGNMALMFTTISSAGVLGPEAVIDSRTCECCQTAMTATPDGFVAVYRDRSDKEIRDISIARYAGGKWAAPEQLTKDGWEIDGCPVNGPSVSSNGKNVAVAWFTAPDDKNQVNLLMSSDGGKTFGRKIRVDGGNSTGHVQVVSFSNGDAAVSWIEHTSQGSQLHVRRFAANGTAAAPINVSAGSGVSSQAFPRMVVSGNDVIIAWTDSAQPSHVRTSAVSF